MGIATVVLFALALVAYLAGLFFRWRFGEFAGALMLLTALFWAAGFAVLGALSGAVWFFWFR